jgi:hypothetical protein
LCVSVKKKCYANEIGGFGGLIFFLWLSWMS